MLLPLQGAIPAIHTPRALPWAMGRMPLRGETPYSIVHWLRPAPYPKKEKRKYHLRTLNFFFRMRKITLIILHCSATREDRRFTFDDCKRDHTQNRKYKDIGYHFYIELDGKMTEGRPIEKIGAHCLNHNKHSIGICLEGGLDKFGNFADTRTGAQEITLLNLLARLKVEYPNALIVGHNTLDPDRACPCFDTAEYRELFP